MTIPVCNATEQYFHVELFDIQCGCYTIIILQCVIRSIVTEQPSGSVWPSLPYCNFQCSSLFGSKKPNNFWIPLIVKNCSMNSYLSDQDDMDE